MIDFKLITDITIEAIDHDDYPDFVDAYISSATYDGRDATEEELDEINQNTEYVYEAVIAQLF
jgi:hypothetical protein